MKEPNGQLEFTETQRVEIRNDIRDPIGYGWCKLTKQLCVFNYAVSVRCSMHPCNCGSLQRPRFIKKSYEETFNVQKDMETAKETPDNLDPDSHK